MGVEQIWDAPEGRTPSSFRDAPDVERSRHDPVTHINDKRERTARGGVVFEGLKDRAQELFGSGPTDSDSDSIDDGVPPRRSRLFAAVITGTYAWALTVLAPLSVHGAASPAGVTAGLALLSLLLSPLVPPGRWALVFALDLFVGLSFVSWWVGSHQLVEPPFAVFGSFGWLAYTLALGALSTPERVDAASDPGPALEPRTRPSRLSAAVLALVVLGVLVILGAAWQVERPGVSVLAHVVALCTVLLVLRSGAHLSTYVQVAGTKLGRPLSLRGAVVPLLSLALIGGVAVVLALSGR